MDITFKNGSQEQQEAVAKVFTQLMGFDANEIPLTIQVEFTGATSDPDNQFALGAIDGGKATLTFRDDAPVFADTLTAGLDAAGQASFFREIAVRELGRMLIESLIADDRDELAAMFGTTPETWAVGAWADRPLEGICETFKAAFLPQSSRIFHNRTNIQLSLRQYPAFRAFWRNASIQVGAGETGNITVAPTTNLFAKSQFFIEPHFAPGVTPSSIENTLVDLGEVPAKWHSVYNQPPTEPYRNIIWGFRAVAAPSAGTLAKIKDARDSEEPLYVEISETFGGGSMVDQQSGGSTIINYDGVPARYAISEGTMAARYVWYHMEKFAPTDRDPYWPRLTPAELADILPPGTVLEGTTDFHVRALWRMEDQSYSLGVPSSVAYDFPVKILGYWAWLPPSPAWQPGVRGYVPWGLSQFIDVEYVGEDPPPSGGIPETDVNPHYRSENVSIHHWPAPRFKTHAIDIPEGAVSPEAILVGRTTDVQHAFEPDSPPRFDIAGNVSGGFATWMQRSPFGAGQYWYSPTPSIVGHGYEELPTPGLVSVGYTSTLAYLRYGGGTIVPLDIDAQRGETEADAPASGLHVQRRPVTGVQ